MPKNILSILIQKISSEEPTGFIKFGDGEYFCMDNTHPGGSNIDRDNFTPEKGRRLIAAFNMFVKHFSFVIYLGKWHEDKWDWHHFLSDNTHISWADYHTLLLDGDAMQDKIELYTAIKKSSLKKIYIGNRYLKRVQVLLSTDEYIEVPPNNWFDNDFDRILQQVLHVMEHSSSPCIVMTSAGMAAKILLADIVSRHPKTIVLDFGSAFDLICTGRQSRTWEPPRPFLLQLLSNLIDDKERWNQDF